MLDTGRRSMPVAHVITVQQIVGLGLLGALAEGGYSARQFKQAFSQLNLLSIKPQVLQFDLAFRYR
jgi:hypothetical protein